jgi:hypothetical protein
MMLRSEVEKGLRQQADHCAHNGAPGTAAICRAMIALARGDTECGKAIANWPRGIIDDAVPLRLAGGIHDLYRRGLEPALRAVYHGETGDGETGDQVLIDKMLADIVARHDADLVRWFGSAPQTNEAGRSAGFVAALHWLSARTAPQFELLEIGSSAGMNLLIDRWRYDLDGIISGPANAPLTIHPEWRGPPPPACRFAIDSVRGCDLNPIDVNDEAAAERLRAYIWPEMAERFARMDAGISMIRQHGVDLVRADAADWVETQLSLPQRPGVTRTLMHSIVWQYLPEQTQSRITSAMETAAAQASAEHPLAWIALETNRETMRHELSVRYWPGGNDPVLLGQAHAHGIWFDSFMGSARKNP